MRASNQHEAPLQASGPSPADQPATAISTAEKAAVKKLSVLLPADLHRRARRHALLHDKTLTTLIIELLTGAVESSEPQPPER